MTTRSALFFVLLCASCKTSEHTGKDTGTQDLDGDGWGEPEDCNDNDPAVNPAATEVCDSIDNNCNEEIDEGETITCYYDEDGDGFGIDAPTITACVCPASYATTTGDCDDTHASVYPGAKEICQDGFDNDCDATTDAGCEISGEAALGDVAESYLYDEPDNDTYGAGWSTAGAGDVNGDGAMDVLVGAPGEQGQAYLLFGPVGGDRSLATSDAILAGGLDEAAGFFVSSAGDVDEDGFSDILVSVPFYQTTWSGNPSEPGAVFLVNGPVSGEHDLTSVANAIMFGGPDDICTRAGRSAGDIDGDGQEELMAMAMSSNTYHVYILPDIPTFDVVLADVGWRIEGEESNDDAIGASAGDVNADGYDDLIFGSYSYGGTGAAYLVNGPLCTSMNLSDADVRLVGETSAAGVGYAVDEAGDVNSDGYGDLLIGAPSMENESGTDSGGAYLLVGPLSEAAMLQKATAKLYGIYYEGIGSFNTGDSVAGAGDLNHDGYDDILIGGGAISMDMHGRGSVFVMQGPVTGQVDLETGADAWFIEENEGGVSSIDGLGDTNMDGFDDFVVGCSNYDPNKVGWTDGWAFIIEGSGI